MASTRASISKGSKRPQINIIPPKQLFVDLTQDDTKTSSPKLQLSLPSAPNAPSKTPSTKDTSSSSIDYIPKSPTLSPNGYLNPPTSPPPRVSLPPSTQENASMDITLTLSPITPLDVQFDTPSPSPPILGHPIPWNLLEAYGDSYALSKITSTSFAHLSKQVLVEELKEKSIDEKEVIAVIEEEGHTWMTPVYEYLTEEILQEEKRKARAVHRKAGIMHSGARSVVEKALRSGYYWPTMHMDARNLIRECSDRQVHRPVPRNPQEKLNDHHISVGPFYKWGIDIVGLFRRAKTRFKFLISGDALGINLDLLEEKREQTAIQEARSKANMEKYYNVRVRSTSFHPGDLVYRNNEASHAEDGGNLGPKWEGPYEVTETLGKGAYKLRDRNGNTFSRTWNVCNLKKCYIA
ncbi:hypothetical protein Tco_0856106 [Tanacetum coccineum]